LKGATAKFLLKEEESLFPFEKTYFDNIIKMKRNKRKTLSRNDRKDERRRGYSRGRF